MDDLFEGIDLPEEARAALSERFNTHTEGLVNTNKSFKSEKQELIEKNKADNEELTSFRQKAEELKDKELFDKGEFETLLNKKVSEKQNAFDEYKKGQSEKESGYTNQLTELNKRIHKMQLKEQISKVALSDEHFDKTDTSVEILEMLAARAFETDNDGNFKYKGEKLDVDGNPMNFKSWFDSEIKSGYAQLFNGKGGAGVTNAKTKTGHIDNDSIKQMSQKEYKEARKKGLI